MDSFQNSHFGEGDFMEFNKFSSYKERPPIHNNVSAGMTFFLG